MNLKKIIKKNFKIKKILAKIEVSPLKKDTIKFLNWFSKYNLIPRGMALKLSLLSSQAIENLSEEKYKDFEVNVKNHSFELSKEQKKSLKLMNKLNNKFRVHVLQGTTGSGKTIVYFEALKVLINKGFSRVNFVT
jgi:primosomal protein N' (replication factor Y)